MGIRFHCPQCQNRLHVKSFLAGKRGVCPKCGTSIDIPAESELAEQETAAPATAVRQAVHVDVAASSGSSSKKNSSTANLEPETKPPPQIKPQIKPIAKPQPKSQPAAPSPLPGKQAQKSTGAAASASRAPAKAAPQPRTNGTSHAAPLEVPADLAAAIETPAGADPLAESPHSVWYVRPPSGGQFGPAHADLMQRWLAEGRVTADSYIWRDGWPDWRIAGDVLPSLRGPAPVATAATPSSATPLGATAMPKVVPAPAIPAAAAASVLRYQKKKRARRGMWTAAVIVLSLLAIGLIVTLIIVLRR